MLSKRIALNNGMDEDSCFTGVASIKVVGRESTKHLAATLLSSHQPRSDVSHCTAHACIQKQRLKNL